MNKKFYYLAWFSLLSSAAAIIIVLVWLLYPYKTVDFFNTPFPIHNEGATVSHGKVLWYGVDYCKYTDIRPKMVKYFVDGVIYQTSETIGILSKGCHVDEVGMYIPWALPNGEFSVEIVAQFQVNPIRTITVESQTQTFIVK